MAAVRYTWMFRTAAVVFLLFGAACALWRYGFTDYRPEQRPYGLAAGALALLVGVFLFRRGVSPSALSAASARVRWHLRGGGRAKCERAGHPVSRRAGHRLRVCMRRWRARELFGGEAR